MLNVGLVGIGFMGWIHYLAYQRSPIATLKAICTRDPVKQSGDWSGIKGNFGPAGHQVDLSAMSVYSDLKSLLADPNIDAVDICLPPALHKQATIEALAAGKHVLCEKPMALTSEDCQSMLSAAKDANRILCIAHVLPYMSQFAWALQLAREKRYGAVRSAHLKRIISDPSWLPEFYDRAVTGGPLLDLHIHDAHFMQLLFGIPTEVSASGWLHQDSVQYAQMLYRFADPSVAVTASSGVGSSAARGFTHGFEIQFDQATLTFEFAAHVEGAVTLGPMIYEGADKASSISLEPMDEIDAFVAEIEDFAKSIEAQHCEMSCPLNPVLASEAVKVCHRVDESVRSSKSVSIC